MVSLLVAAADFRLANSAREAALSFQRRFATEPGTVWFEGHWGFQYYMAEWGAKALDVGQSPFVSGDVVVMPRNNAAVTPIPLDKITPPEKVSFKTIPFVATMDFNTGAAFYSSVRGPMPWAIGRVLPEYYVIARFR
jgi:hypothetical protein